MKVEAQSTECALVEGQVYRAGARRVRVESIDLSSGVPRAIVREVFPPCPGAMTHEMLGGACCRRSKADLASFEVQTNFANGAWRMPPRYLLES